MEAPAPLDGLPKPPEMRPGMQFAWCMRDVATGENNIIVSRRPDGMPWVFVSSSIREAQAMRGEAQAAANALGRAAMLVAYVSADAPLETIQPQAVRPVAAVPERSPLADMPTLEDLSRTIHHVRPGRPAPPEDPGRIVIARR